MKEISFKLGSELEPYEHDIRRFVDAMLYKMKVHSNKGRWQDVPLAKALDLLKGEVTELKEAVKGGNTIEVTLEAADIANYAMIISSIKTERGK